MNGSHFCVAGDTAVQLSVRQIGQAVLRVLRRPENAQTYWTGKMVCVCVVVRRLPALYLLTSDT